VCPITGRSGPIPEGHSLVTQPTDAKPADTNYKTKILPTTCPFSPDYVSKENDGETLPECSQQ
jgi:hypothetical protein